MRAPSLIGARLLLRRTGPDHSGSWDNEDGGNSVRHGGVQDFGLVLTLGVVLLLFF